MIPKKAQRGALGGGKAISGSNPSACKFLDQEKEKSFGNVDSSLEEERRTTLTCPEGYLPTADHTLCFAAEDDWGDDDDLPTYGRAEQRKLPSCLTLSVSEIMLKNIFSYDEDGIVLVVQDILLAKI